MKCAIGATMSRREDIVAYIQLMNKQALFPFRATLNNDADYWLRKRSTFLPSVPSLTEMGMIPAHRLLLVAEATVRFHPVTSRPSLKRSHLTTNAR